MMHSIGAVLRFNNNQWEVLDPQESGFWVPGEGRSINILNRGSGRVQVVCTQNDGEVLVFERE